LCAGCFCRTGGGATDGRKHTTELIRFDLERAKTGDPVQTRDGRRFGFVTLRPTADDPCERVAFRGVKGEQLLVSERGKYLHTDAPSFSDLYMVAEREPSREDCEAFALAAIGNELLLVESLITLAKYAIMHGAVAVPSPSEVAAECRPNPRRKELKALLAPMRKPQRATRQT